MIGLNMPPRLSLRVEDMSVEDALTLVQQYIDYGNDVHDRHPGHDNMATAAIVLANALGVK